MRIGIDTGGAFTDLVFLGAGDGRVHKVPSTPDNLLRAILAGIKELRLANQTILAGFPGWRRAWNKKLNWT